MNERPTLPIVPSSLYEDGRNNKFFHGPDGKYHRDDGPAIEWANGNVEWWYRGVYTDDKMEYLDPYWRAKIVKTKEKEQRKIDKENS